METKKPTTGPYSQKRYRCDRCGLEQTHGSNHWGEIYPACRGCSGRNPLSPQAAMTCLEPMPEGYDRPMPWRMVKLSEVVEVKGR